MKKLILLGSAFYFAMILISMLITESAYAQAGAPRFGGTDDFDDYDSSLPAGKWFFYVLFLIAVWWGIMQLIEELSIPESLGALIYGCWFFFGIVGLMMIPPVYFISATLIVFAVIFISMKLSENTNLQNSPETKKSDKWIKDKSFDAEQWKLKENEKFAKQAAINEEKEAKFKGTSTPLNLCVNCGVRFIPTSVAANKRSAMTHPCYCDECIHIWRRLIK